MMILAIETSCDETSAAVVERCNGRFYVRSNFVSSQIHIHKKYGGVVPEIAARKQAELIIPVIEHAIRDVALPAKPLSRPHTIRIRNHESWIKESRFAIRNIDALAVTAGPGLMIALSVGVETARTLAAVWKKPIIAINHLEGHLYSALLPAPQVKSQKSKVKSIELRFPAIALIVSGGHTELILVKNFLKYQLLGQTRDDAAGEAYDKVARLLGLGYPGGPLIDRLAQKGNSHSFNFPRGMIQSHDYDFSFAGLKTAVLYKLQEITRSSDRVPRRMTGQNQGNNKPINDNKLINNICASFQAAVADVLVAKTVRAAQQYKIKTIFLGGGVAANSQLRKQLTEKILEQLPNTKYLIPDTSFTTDNAAMIAAAAAFHAERKQFTPWQKLRTDPNLTL